MNHINICNTLNMDKVFFARDDSTTSYEISLYNTKKSCCSYTETGEIDKADAIWEGPGNWIILYFTCICTWQNKNNEICAKYLNEYRFLIDVNFICLPGVMSWQGNYLVIMYQFISVLRMRDKHVSIYTKNMPPYHIRQDSSLDWLSCYEAGNRTNICYNILSFMSGIIFE